MKKLFATVMAALLSIGMASAEITDAQIKRVMAARGATVETMDADTYLVTTPSGAKILVGALDQLGDGRRSILAFFGVFAGSNGRTAFHMNQWNSQAVSKGIIVGSSAGVSHTVVTINDVSDAAILGAWDLFMMEFFMFNAFLQNQNPLTSSALAGPEPDPRALHDGGLTLAEIQERDRAFAVSLNQAKTVTPATIGMTFEGLKRKALINQDQITNFVD